jgi:DNA-directed RNA polymerase specialized sigma24 family protein
MACLKTERLLLKSLGQLNELERKAIYLHYWIPMDIDEISRELKISKKKTTNILEDAVLKLRGDFNRAGFNIEISKPSTFWNKIERGLQ